MGQIVSNRTGREKIIKAEGRNTEIKIYATARNGSVDFKSELKLSEKHNFKPNYQIKIQAYEKNGLAKEPMDMGTVKEPYDISYAVDDISLDTILFRLKVLDEKNVIRGYADEIPVSGIGDEGDDKSSPEGEQADTLLPIIESKEIKVPFAVGMTPDDKPKLLVKSGLNLKEHFKNNISFKVLIYTSVIRQILTTYLTDKQYDDDIYKKQFIEKIVQNSGGDISDPPSSIYNEEGDVDEEALRWIEEATAGCLGRTVKFKGKNVSLLNSFEEFCRRLNGGDEDEG